MTAKTIDKILVTGATGLVGSRFKDLAKNDFSISTIGRTDVDLIVDLLLEQEVETAVKNSDAEAVINFAAYTNVDGAEEEKGNEDGEVYKLNALLPYWLAKACRLSGKKLYHISTDYVFDGKQEDRPYEEEDIPEAVDSWYSQTKVEGEKKVKQGFRSEENFAIVRISYPYSGVYQKKSDVARTVVKKLQDKLPYTGIVDQKIKPTSVDDIAQALKFLLSNSLTGTYHVAGNFGPKEFITPLEFAQKIAEIFKLDSSLIQPVSFAELSKDRKAPRPQHTWLSTKKIENLGFTFTGINEALTKFQQQLATNKFDNEV